MASCELFINYNLCTYCQEEIVDLRVKCTECADFTLCLQCFSNGAEIGPHKNNHGYKFTNSCSMSVMSQSGWASSEELAILDAIENFGYGNWEDVALHVGTRTPDEARDEFVNKFLDGNIGEALWGPLEKLRPQIQEYTSSDDGPLGPAAMAKMPPLDVTIEEATSLGYMPQRDDFDREHDNTAELLVSSLSVNPDDDELDIALKLSQVDMYMQSLRERARRKRVVRDYQLISQFFVSRKERPRQRKLSREQKDLEEKFRFLCQFLTASEYDQLLNSLHREHELRKRFEELLKYRSNGITTFEECIQFNEMNLDRQSKKTPDSGNDIPTFHCSPLIRKRQNGKSDSNFTGKKYTYYIEPLQTSLPSIDFGSPRSLSLNIDYYHLLSSTEKQLCSSYNIYPSDYILLKNVLMTQAVILPKNKPQYIQAILSYLTENGWIC